MELAIARKLGVDGRDKLPVALLQHGGNCMPFRRKQGDTATGVLYLRRAADCGSLSLMGCPRAFSEQRTACRARASRDTSCMSNAIFCTLPHLLTVFFAYN
jgi:hypothetical protein